MNQKEMQIMVLKGALSDIPIEVVTEVQSDLDELINKYKEDAHEAALLLLMSKHLIQESE